VSQDPIDDRRRALEEAFFAKQDQELLRRMRADDPARPERDRLAEASGLSDGAVLDRLVALGFGGGTVAALSLVPLVAVAWADGSLDARERDAVLSAAGESGLGGAGPGRTMLESWLDEAPTPELLAAWTDYVRALPAEARAGLRAGILGRARRVAEATGGFLGLTRSVSDAEEAVLRRLETAFA